MRERYSSIDLLRFIAASSVAFTHLIILNSNSILNLEIISSISVEVFFIISGFVLAPQIMTLAKNNNFYNYKIFLIRRWYRTIPIYILSLFLTSIVLDKFFSLDFIKYLFFIQNFLFLNVKTDYFSISWSLSVEEWFYIIFPLFLIIGFRIKSFYKSINILYLSWFFIFLILLIRIFFVNEGDWGTNVRRIVIFRLDAIVFGFILYFYKDKINFNIINFTILIILFLFFSKFLFEIMKFNALQKINFYQFIFHYCVAIWGSLMVILFYLVEKLINNININKVNIFLGKISYSIYLFHLLTIYLVASLNFSLLPTIIIFIFLQITISVIIYYFFEEPILKSRPNYK